MADFPRIISSPGRCPKGWRKHWRYEREWGNASQGRKMRIPPSPWGKTVKQEHRLPASKHYPRGEGGERSEPDRVLAVRKTDEESREVRGHSFLLSNLWCTALKPEAPRIYTEHLSMILRTRIRLKRMLAQKNDRSPFFPIWKVPRRGKEGSLRQAE